MKSPTHAGWALAAGLWLVAQGAGFAGLQESRTPPAKREQSHRSDHREPNLLENGDFRQGLDGWTFQAWQDEVAKAEDDPKAAPFGYASIRITQPAPTDSSLTQEVKLKAGRRYRLSGWIKTQDVKKWEGAIQRPGKEGASLTILGGYVKTPSVVGTQDWTEVSMEFTVKPGETTVRLGPRLGHYGKLSTGTAWFADLSLVELKN